MIEGVRGYRRTALSMEERVFRYEELQKPRQTQLSETAQLSRPPNVESQQRTGELQ